MICAIFLSSLDEIVCINTSDFNDLKLLNEKKNHSIKIAIIIIFPINFIYHKI